jgi:predicted RNA-binding protein
MILVGKYINENKEYKNPDILYSKMKIGNKIEIFKKNKLNIEKNKNNSYFIYHMFDKINDNYSGRWYNNNVNKNEIIINTKENKLIYIINNFEYEENNKIKIYKKVKMEIFFTEKGMKSLEKI